MMISSVKDLFFMLIQREAVSRETLVGCNNKEILDIEQHFGCNLPTAYRDFLTIAGKGAGKLFRGTDIFYPRVLHLQSEAKDLLSELNRSELMPGDAKVFCMHQGYEINYFLPVSDDPPVFQFVEGQDDVTQPWESFSDFMITSIESHLTEWRNLNQY